MLVSAPDHRQRDMPMVKRKTRMGSVSLSVMTAALGLGAASDAPTLFLLGDASADGTIQVLVRDPAHASAVPILVFGTGMLVTNPTPTNAGPLFMTTVQGVVALPPIGPIGFAGTSPLRVPPVPPGALGTHLVAQAYVAGELSNPVSLPLVAPQYSPQDVQHLFPTHAAAGLQFGHDLATGDVTGDGIPDLVVGTQATFVTAGPAIGGTITVCAGPTLSAYTVLHPPAPQLISSFGHTVAVADIDADGVADLCGSELDHGSATAKGRVRVFRGGTPVSGISFLTLESANAGAPASGFGASVAPGDLNGDGYLDLAIGDMNATVQGKNWAGRAIVHFGPNFTATKNVYSSDITAGDFFATLLEACDATGDGIMDLVEASDRDDAAGMINTGRAHVFAGPTLALAATLVDPMFPTAQGFGSVLVCADIDHDQKSEVLVKGTGGLLAFQGPAFHTWKTLARPPTTHLTATDSYFSFLRAARGDGNADGYLDLFLPDYSEAVTSPCGIQPGVYRAVGPFFATFQRLADVPISCTNEFGFAVATADFDQNGLLDLAVGTPSGDTVYINAGYVTVFR
jgi:FG-GAP repeat